MSRKLPEKADMFGVTLMMEAAKHNVLGKIHETVEAGHNINAKDNADYTALLHAVVAGHEEAALLLMHHGAELQHVTRAGQTALHIGVEKDMDGVVQRWIVKKGPLDVQEKVEGRTALMIAIERENIWAAEQLILAGADFDRLKDRNGSTAEEMGLLRFAGKDREFFKNAIQKRRTDEAAAKKLRDEAMKEAAHKLEKPVEAPAAATFRKRGPKLAA